MSLTTQYLGLTLKNPLVASAAPPNAHLDHLRHLEDAGAAAVVLPSLFEEQIEAETALEAQIYDLHANNSPEATSYFPEPIAGPYGVGPDAYLDLVRRARAALSIPVIASLNGATDAGWTNYAQLLQQAGAQAIELNVALVPIDITLDGREVEERILHILASVRRVVNVPVAVKLGPFVSSLGHFAMRLVEAGADGLVLFNRLVQPDIDIVRLAFDTHMPLSRPEEMRLPLLWISLLAGRLKASLAASTGVDRADDVVKALLAGADVVMTSSAVLRYGPNCLSIWLDDLRAWMTARDFKDIAELRGLMSGQKLPNKELLGRPSYMKMLGDAVMPS
ncbi:dihydroorotate dehydrogenase (fumarate) [Arboricoccus pini]|uniref:Dihydroorotate dehydrogenase (Fumarate) n=1 Tax=Arboricoccus pini TaxID=1963835 RepID=A0A212QS34_9PROT|nr:dihydroorotate dehydrogenase-like protein [Arboricoccus pini]SNB62266.1 dihydroorotate dehydrogenase (fumarate) [Arboricoccus pini]